MASAKLLSWMPLVLPFLTVVDANCYYPNGTDANRLWSQDYYLPCDAGDSVMDQGYDPVTGNPLNRADSTVTITPCDDGSYCCGNGTIAQSCCNNGNGYFIDANGEAVQSNPSTSGPASSTSGETLGSISKSSQPSFVASITVTATLEKTNTVGPSTSRPAILSASATLQEASTGKASQASVVASVTVAAVSKQSNSGAIAGGVVGGIVGLALIGVGAFLLWRRGKRTMADPSKGESPNGIESYANKGRSPNGIQAY